MLPGNHYRLRIPDEGASALSNLSERHSQHEGNQHTPGSLGLFVGQRLAGNICQRKRLVWLRGLGLGCEQPLQLAKFDRLCRVNGRRLSFLMHDQAVVLQSAKAGLCGERMAEDFRRRSTIVDCEEPVGDSPDALSGSYHGELPAGRSALGPAG